VFLSSGSPVCAGFSARRAHRTRLYRLCPSDEDSLVSSFPPVAAISTNMATISRAQWGRTHYEC
jgi:hypothetical protein